MLVFCRRDGEQFVCEQLDLKFTVLESHNGRTKIGIEAPRDVIFHRSEVLLKLQQADEKFANLAQPAA